MFRILYILPIVLVTLPLQMCIAVCVLVASGWPVVYKQKRVGKSGRVFTLYKFRSMSPHADIEKEEYLPMNEADGPVFKIHNDPRFTPIGKFLSHTGLDELPQVWNVLRGEMALVGPRPLPIGEAKKLKPWMRVRHEILPGIISPAILSGKYHEDFDAWMRSDVRYAKQKAIHEDVRLAGQSMLFLMFLFVAELRKRHEIEARKV